MFSGLPHSYSSQNNSLWLLKIDPPDFQEEAVKTVLKQAELICADIEAS